MLTAIAIFLVSASVMVVLRVGAQDVLSEKITPGRLGQFVLYVSKCVQNGPDCIGWGGRIRTSAWRNQNPLPYRLATPQTHWQIVGRLGRRVLFTIAGDEIAGGRTIATQPLRINVCRPAVWACALCRRT